jgi:hypothetical protein
LILAALLLSKSSLQSYAFSVPYSAGSRSCTRNIGTLLYAEAQQQQEQDKEKPTSQQLEPYLGPSVSVPDILDFDLTGGRPGAIIETEEQLIRKAEMLQEIASGERDMPDWMADYGTSLEEDEAEYDTDDPKAIDAATLGQYDIHDLASKFEYEWDPEVDDDPNIIDTNTAYRYIEETPKDEEGIEIGYDPMFGPSNPIDTRTRIGTLNSYMVDEVTRNERNLPQQFLKDDVEIEFNAEVAKFRESLNIIETYVDPFLPETLPVPRNVAKWFGYPEPLRYPPQNYTNNRFTKTEDLTNFDALGPYRARRKAVELARAKNAEWMPDGVSQEYHRSQRQPYDDHGTLVGSLVKGESDPDIVELIQPALKVLGSCCDLLSMEGERSTVFRFHYHGLIKNKHGMAAWTETLIRDCGVEVTGVVFETGFRRRDPAYDGGDLFWDPIFR